MTDYEWKQLLDEWTLLSDAGAGFSVGGPDYEYDASKSAVARNIQAVNLEGWEHIGKWTAMGGAVLAHTPDGRYILVRDSNGPWGQDVTDVARRILE